MHKYLQPQQRSSQFGAQGPEQTNQGQSPYSQLQGDEFESNEDDEIRPGRIPGQIGGEGEADDEADVDAGRQSSDESICEDVRTHLAADLIDCSHIEISVMDGVVTLAGEVSDLTDKRRIEQLAAQVPLVAGVVNQLRHQDSAGSAHDAPTSPSSRIGDAKPGTPADGADSSETSSPALNEADQ